MNAYEEVDNPSFDGASLPRSPSYHDATNPDQNPPAEGQDAVTVDVPPSVDGSGSVPESSKRKSLLEVVGVDDRFHSSGGENKKDSLTASRLVPSVKVKSTKYPSYNIKRLNKKLVFPLAAMLKGYWHTILQAGTMSLISAIFVCYILTFLAFTPIYMAINDECGLKLGESGTKFSDALYLSVETMTTIGYGVPDPYYNGCGWGFVCVIGQSLLGFCMNAILFGTVFARVSRAQRRAVSLKFSPKACIREIWGRYFLTFQVCETRQQQVVSSTVSMYAALQNSWSETPYQCHALRTIRPDDSVSRDLLLCIPSTVVHELDVWSALTPPHKPDQVDTFPDLGSAYRDKWPSTRQRFDDTTTGNINAFYCMVCGDCAPSISVLRRHCAHSAAAELAEAPDEKPLCLEDGQSMPWESLSDYWSNKHPTSRIESTVFNENWIKGQKYNHANVYNRYGNRHDGYDQVGPHRFTREEIQNWLKSTMPEIICILNAVDVATGSNFETQHSYTYEDIEWDARHTPCVFSDPETHAATIDFKAFLETSPAEPIPEGQPCTNVQFHL